MDLLKHESGKHFDPDLVALFLEILPEVLEVRARWSEDGMEEAHMANSRILVVEDDPISQAILEDFLQKQGYALTLAEDAATAWAALNASGAVFEALLLDRNLPDMDGLELLGRIKKEPALERLPVIMQTAMTAEEDVRAGLEAGAHYYVTKPFDPVALGAIVRAAIKDFRDFQSLQDEARHMVDMLSLLATARFSFTTPKQARDLAALLANVCPDAQRIVLGLSELMLNAVEHGNLGITYDEKTDLMSRQKMGEEIEARLQQAPYAGREAQISFERTAEEIRFVVRDQGEGFAWEEFLELSPERAFHPHGRGIAMARKLSFSEISYRGCGNEVLAVLKLAPN